METTQRRFIKALYVVIDTVLTVTPPSLYNQRMGVSSYLQSRVIGHVRLQSQFLAAPSEPLVDEEPSSREKLQTLLMSSSLSVTELFKYEDEDTVSIAAVTCTLASLR